MDLLDRSMGHWQISPNIDRWQYHFEDLNDAPLSSTRVSLTKETRNWSKIAEFADLTELTLDRPDKRQIEMLSKLPHLKRLRISHTRSKKLDGIEELTELEELVLEYASGIERLDIIGALPNLAAIHLENLRNVRDFSGLGNLETLRYLGITGTLDRKQTIRSFEFLRKFQRLETLRLTGLNVLSNGDQFSPFEHLTSLKKIYVASDVFELEFFAWFQAKFPHVEGAIRSPYDRYGGTRERVSAPDIYATMPEELVKKEAPGIEIDEDGSRWRSMNHGAILLGKGERTVQGSKATVDAKCAAHSARYKTLLNRFLG